MALSRAFLLLLVLCLCFSSFGQQPPVQPPVSGPPGSPATRTIQGLVLDPAGAPVPGAIVLIKDTKTLEVRSYIAGRDGAYHFYGLNTEVNYELRAETQGLSSAQKTVSVFDSHRVVKLNLKLKPRKKRKSKGKDDGSQNIKGSSS